MSDYKLEIKQVVDYPRCRMYREFIQTLITDRSIHANGGSGLFHYTVLCAYANFRTSYRRLDGINYTVYPGEWVCRLNELCEWFRLRTRRQILGALNALRERRLITYSILGRGKIVKYSVVGWRLHNTILDYNCPCQKNTGFFFLPVSVAAELIGSEKCSEMDIVLDLWINAVYRDERVQGSEVGAVVYFRNGSGNPLTSYAELATRWGISKATVFRILKRLQEHGYLSLYAFPGRHGSVIYLQYYLSVMFQICDIQVDKAEVAMSLHIEFAVEEAELETQQEPTQPEVGGDRGVSTPTFIVSNRVEKLMAVKVLQSLMEQGFSCAQCPKFHYKLYRLSRDCKGGKGGMTPNRGTACYQMELFCSTSEPTYCFELRLTRQEGGTSHAENEN